MQKVILDFDNTMGVKRSDIDDGLTFAYLYAHPDINIMGLTCTFANNHEHVVYYNTIQMLEDMGVSDVPVFKGGRNPEEYNTEAVDFLVSTVNENPGEITVIAIGSLCNIAGAYQKDNEFFNKIKHLILMGGILEPLYLNESLCNELNFSIDYKSACKVIFNCKKLTIMSSQCTQDAIYGELEIKRLLQQNTNFINLYLPVINEWIEYICGYYGNRQIFINWDLCTAIYLTHPELFEDKICRIVKCEDSMKTGLLVEDKELKYADDMVTYINIPTKILDVAALNEEFYSIMNLLK